MSEVTETKRIYSELEPGHIRLVQILPKEQKGKSTVCCRIRHHRLHEKFQYIALSYAWGAPDQFRSIRLNGHRTCVRENLWAFLHQARESYTSHSGWYWIDAICIDQANNTERTHQVNLMSRIYSSAKSVLIWLGPREVSSIRPNEDNDSSEDDDTSDEFDSDRLMIRIKQKRAMPHSYSYMLSPRDTKKTHKICRGWDDCLKQLCERAYWGRLWVLQELLLARKIQVMCGSKLTTWELFTHFILELHNSDDFSEPLKSSAAIRMAEFVSAEPGSVPLTEMCLASRHLRCTEPRDRVYALLGVANQGRTTIEPDYQVPLPALANALLRNKHEFEGCPKAIEDVEYQCIELEKFLFMDWGSMFDFAGRPGSFPLPSNIPVDVRLGPIGSPVTLWWARYYGHSAVEETLHEMGCYSVNEALVNAAENGNDASLGKILALEKQFSTPEQRLNQQRLNLDRLFWPLLAAIQNGNHGAVRLLIDVGGYDFALDISHHKEELLLTAIDRLDVEMAKILLDRSNGNASYGEAPLSLAVTRTNDQRRLICGRAEEATVMVQLLLRCGKVSVPCSMFEDCGMLQSGRRPA
ncbi:hypothetical protein LTR56_019751 [Elasticomyces elasticus]|nr:hypothetical protein LTR22_024331 [Elasticomyces elasticus]KAK3626478.1 hypothetical protein LTR56_019751 [Elasticomyces elasticus]KAK4911316.1 hypothetical protein LTR49_020136 [Elasticomyces elasticus]KAK5743918.1 hypothetical protein LTS12_023645 [Elasticomyces elasticus]